MGNFPIGKAHHVGIDKIRQKKSRQIKKDRKKLVDCVRREEDRREPPEPSPQQPDPRRLEEVKDQDIDDDRERKQTALYPDKSCLGTKTPVCGQRILGGAVHGNFSFWP